jgi:C_GCAxxG_C_C family probable redox protein
MEVYRMKNGASGTCEHRLSHRNILKTFILTRAAALVGFPNVSAGGEPQEVLPADAPAHAVDRFMKSMNCAQAILETYAPSMGISKELARRLAAPFAGGMGMGRECGAVTGALMVIGLKYGKIHDKDPGADWKTFAKVAEFVKEFKARHNHTECSRLLKVDMGTRAGVKDAGRKGLFTTSCPGFVRSASEILDKILV